MEIFPLPVVGIVNLYLTLPTTIFPLPVVGIVSLFFYITNYGGSEYRVTQDQRAEGTLKRSLKESFVFNNIYQADLLEQINKKEEDGLFIEGSEKSVGAIIKSAAISSYHRYYEDNKLKPMITLGLNNILDLSYVFPDSQSALFIPDQWKNLKRSLKKYNDTKPCHINRKAQSTLSKAEIIAQTDLPKASDYLNGYLYKYKPKLSQDDAFIILYVHAFICEFLAFNQYMFDKNIEKNEQDCIVKFWGPLMEKLVQNTGLRLKWGESSCSIAPNRLRADVRVIYDNKEGQQHKEYDIMQIEASRISPTKQQFDFGNQLGYLHTMRVFKVYVIFYTVFKRVDDIFGFRNQLRMIKVFLRL
ncbi:uncharacterized protein EV154DRAFT_574709 [Mucor mucedo]|uniref:uncharacterized protein n=1 Tax=Mucor mucedo TaxID=29922 RepID=UPI00221FA008|nr:uncharacterized protein EV154DRAFT_574709 [Mucor mucedo]KAI7884130.1 hypothetical protein EV154DRAFT_574709 [Mucor mucedo]